MTYFLMILISGLWFYVYTIYCFKKKKVLYTIRENLVILKDKHFRLQKELGLINLISFIIIGVFTFYTKEEFRIIYITVGICFFWISNYIMKYISMKKGYSIMKDHIE
ncbi:hypothetical protein [Clostridium sp.]|uniref:hypothetical protein n=1 Tax=Clostridium sp. TaxID=1506 RepID=UPI0026022983|nr:hypothetical protein [Clostridium sp.]